MNRCLVLCCACLGWCAVATAQSGTRIDRPASVGDTLSATSQGATLLREAGRHLTAVAAKVNPAVVHIESSYETRGGDLIEETGSGVIVSSPKSPELFVVTNRHVVIGAPLDRVNIRLWDGRLIHPTRVLDDMATDLAVLSLGTADLPSAHWGDSDNLDIGHIVLALGSPFGLSQSVTMGIISAKGRRSLGLGGPREVINQDFLQTDAAINPGNSGGPLVDLSGNIVGINTAIASQGGGNEGIGFSIPSNLVKHVVDELLESGRVHRGYLGVKLDNEFSLETALRLRLDRLRGARVVQVYRDTPAYRAGVLVDDVILNFDGIDIEDESHLIHRVSLTPVDKTVRVVVLRAGRETILQVKLIERPGDPRAEQQTPAPLQNGVYPSSWNAVRRRLSVRDLDDGLAAQIGVPAGSRGVVVLALPTTENPAGPAVDATQEVPSDDALRLYDLIVEAGRQPVASATDFEAAISEFAPGESVLLKVQRAVGGQVETRLVLWEKSPAR